MCQGNASNLNSEVSLTNRDFELAKPELEDLRELRQKFLMLQASVLKPLPGEFKLRRYVSMPQNQREGGYKHGVWMGFAHQHFDDAHNGLQFQFGLWDKKIFTFGTWLEQGNSTTFARKLAWSAINRSPERFTSLVAKLGTSYKIDLWRRDANDELSRVASKFRASDIEALLDILNYRDSYFQVWRIISKDKAVALKGDLTKEIARTFLHLLPTYRFLINEGRFSRKTIRRSIVSPEKILTSGMWAEEVVRKLEVKKRRRVEVVSDEPVGYDLRSVSRSTGAVKHIEVKSRKIPGRLALTSNELAAAQRYGESYYVYVVRSDKDIQYIRNPAQVCSMQKRNQPIWELLNWRSHTRRIR